MISYSYLFNCTFDSFQASRKQANDKNAAIYSLPNTGSNYGLAIDGLKDVNNELVPVQVTTDLNYESPEIGRNSNIRPVAMNITLTITATNTAYDGATDFTLYKYDSLAKVPESNYHGHAADATASWTFSVGKGLKFVMTESVQSDKVAVYRCVKT